MDKTNAETIQLNKKAGRDASLDAVKGFAILLVMLGHCIVLNGLADPYLYDAIAAVQMPLFMAVSGYIAGLKRPEAVESPNLAKRAAILGKRSISYLVPFFVWMIIVSFPHCLQELKTELFHLDYGLWFLATLWIVNLVCMMAAFLADFAEYKYCQRRMKKQGCNVVQKNQTVSDNAEKNDSNSIENIEKKHVESSTKSDAKYNVDRDMQSSEKDNAESTVKCNSGLWLRFMIFCLVVLCFYIGFFLQARSGNTFLSPSLTVRYLPFYVAAYLFAYHVRPLLQKKETGRLAGHTGLVNVFWLLCLAAFVYLVYAFNMVVVTDTTTLIVQMTASFLGIFVCFYGIAHFCKGRLQRLLAFVGQYTLEIYVLHFRFARILHLSEKNLTPFHADTILWVVAAFVVMSALTVIFISALKQLWITDFLCFGKIRPRRKKGTSYITEKQ